MVLKGQDEMSGVSQPPGWYEAEGDAPGTVRWWDGQAWVGGPQAQGIQQQAGYVAPGADTLESGQQLADPWLRVGARLIDFLLTVIVGTILTLILFSGVIGLEVLVGGAAGNVGAIGAIVVLFGLLGLYFYLMNSFAGGTVGKLALGLRIVDKDGNEPIGPSVGFVRSLMNIVPVLQIVPIIGVLVAIVQFGVAVVSLAFLFSDPKRQTVMDRAAGTYVVKK